MINSIRALDDTEFNEKTMLLSEMSNLDKSK